MPRSVDPTDSGMLSPGIVFDDSMRLLRFYSPLKGQKKLLIDSLKGTAALSHPFHFTLQLLSENACIPLKELIAKNVTVGVKLADGSQAYINGYVESFGCDRADGGFAFYEAEIVPWFSFLNKRINSRIYQDMSVLNVIEKVFGDYKQIATYVFRTSQTYEPESYIVQYDESDEHFVSRLLEKNGLFYYFEHSIDGHTMVISDDSLNRGFCPPHTAHREVEFNAGNRAQREDSVTAFSARRRLHASRVTLNTFDFKSPHGQHMIEGDTIAKQGDVPFLEVYDGSPAFAYKNSAQGDREARRRLEEMEWQGKVFRGKSDCRGFVAGHTFKLQEHHWFDAYAEGDNDFLVLAVEYEARNNYFGKGTDAVYSNEFVAIRRKIPYRPPLLHKPPRMAGPQTAIVVGPAGAEIHTDPFGRIKVQFHWDRHGKHDESSSCWVRVSQPLAGQGYGMFAIPRVGQEVIVDFLDGSCDRPIITGRVYNGDQPVPYGLPASASISGLRSRSTPGGGGYNELAFNDAKDKELVSIRAQKNMFTTVGDSQMTVVNGKDQSVHVTQGDQFTVVKKNIDISSEIGAIFLTANTELILGVGASRMRFRPDGIIEYQGQLVNSPVMAKTPRPIEATPASKSVVTATTPALVASAAPRTEKHINPLGLAGLEQPKTPEDYAAMIRRDYLSGKVSYGPALSPRERWERDRRLAAAKGPMFVPYDRAEEESKRLAFENRMASALMVGNVGGTPGAVSRMLGQDEHQQAAAHRVGGALMQLQMVQLGTPARGSVVIQPRGMERIDIRLDGYINLAKQDRHILGGKGNEETVLGVKAQKGYFKEQSDAQDVLNAYQRGAAKVVGYGRDGGPIVYYEGVAGYHVNMGQGITGQATNVFWIKGKTSVSVVPRSPNLGDGN